MRAKKRKQDREEPEVLCVEISVYGRTVGTFGKDEYPGKIARIGFQELRQVCDIGTLGKHIGDGALEIVFGDDEAAIRADGITALCPDGRYLDSYGQGLRRGHSLDLEIGPIWLTLHLFKVAS